MSGVHNTPHAHLPERVWGGVVGSSLSRSRHSLYYAPRFPVSFLLHKYNKTRYLPFTDELCYVLLYIIIITYRLFSLLLVSNINQPTRAKQNRLTGVIK